MSICNFIHFPLGFQCWIWVLIAPVPGHCSVVAFAFQNAELSNIYTIGCLDAVMKWVEDNLPLFGKTFKVECNHLKGNEFFN